MFTCFDMIHVITARGARSADIRELACLGTQPAPVIILTRFPVGRLLWPVMICFFSVYPNFHYLRTIDDINNL